MNDIGKRISRLGKEKLGEAGEWINEAASPEGPNLRYGLITNSNHIVSDTGTDNSLSGEYLKGTHK